MAILPTIPNVALVFATIQPLVPSRVLFFSEEFVEPTTLRAGIMIRHLLKTDPLARTLLVALFGVFTVVFTYNVADPDLWGHVRYGADTIRQGYVFHTDPYSYLSAGFPWINHELICELTVGFIEPRFGATGLLVWKWLMGVATIVPILWVHRRTPLRSITIVTMSVLLAICLWPGWTVRPQLFTYLFLSLLALMMTEHRRGSRRMLWFAPPLMMAWMNAHGGVVAGMAILCTYVGLASFGEWRRRESGWLVRVAEYAAVVIASAAATLLNPYGPTLITWLWDSLTWPRPEISEWWPISLTNSDYMAFKVLVVVGVVSVVFSRRTRCWSELSILAMAAIQAFLHRRHVPLVAILAAFWLPVHLNDCVRQVRQWARSRSQMDFTPVSWRTYQCGFWGVTLILVIISVLQLRLIRVDRAVFPVSAFQFIEQRGLEGRMVTEFNWGQYCLYSFWPRIYISVDGRFDTCYTREVLDINLDFMMGHHQKWRNRSPKTGPFSADRVLDTGSPNLALVDRQRPDCVRAISKRSDWVLLYQDALAQVWGLRSVYDYPESPNYMPPSLRSISDSAQGGWAAYPALPCGSPTGCDDDRIAMSMAAVVE